MKKELTLIAAVADENNVIGKDGKIPWHISEDLKRYKERTTGNPIIMGRKTHESIGKPLPKRTNIVVTSNKNYQSKGIVVTHSLDEAIEKAKDCPSKDDKIYVIGGQRIYEDAIKIADRLEITHVHKKYEGDTFFPRINLEIWREVSEEHNLNNDPPYSFADYKKR